MVQAKKGDFLEIEYTGSIKDNNLVFDTTDKKKAEEAGIANENASYGSIVICLGEAQVLAGLDNKIEGNEVGKEFSFVLTPDEGFGRKDAKLIQLVSASKFTKNGITPQPGLQVNIDDTVGMIRTVTGGRVLVDFNHPLSGKELVYNVKIKRKIDDAKEKIDAILALELNIKNALVKVEGKKATIELELPQELPKEFQDKIAERIQELTKLDKVELKKKAEKSPDKTADKATAKATDKVSDKETAKTTIKTLDKTSDKAD